MKRSEINKILRESITFIESMHFHLPPFAYWGQKDWEIKGKEYDEIRDNMLGWDITDFGRGDFYKEGLVMFTLRNGNFNLKKYIKPYAEKFLVVREEQITPFHFHWSKMEDIINRSGGNLFVQLYNSTEEEDLSDNPVKISMDGRNYIAPAGTIVKLRPGESITIHPKVYHKFWGEKGGGMVLLGEVSSVNDDTIDNRYLEPAERFPILEEDEPPLYLLCFEYPKKLE